MSGWVKVYNALRSHPKILHAGERASWLYVCGLCYSNEHLTDGFIINHALPSVAPGLKQPGARAQELVVAGLWNRVPDGWQIHDYLDVQQGAEVVRAKREKDALRKAESRGTVRDVSARTPRGVQTVSEGLEEEEKKNRPPLPPEGGRSRDRLSYERNLKSYAENTFPGGGSSALACVKQAVQYAKARDTPAVLAFAREHFPDLEVSA